MSDNKVDFVVLGAAAGLLFCGLTFGLCFACFLIFQDIGLDVLLKLDESVATTLAVPYSFGKMAWFWCGLSIALACGHFYVLVRRLRVPRTVRRYRL